MGWLALGAGGASVQPPALARVAWLARVRPPALARVARVARVQPPALARGAPVRPPAAPPSLILSPAWEGKRRGMALARVAGKRSASEYGEPLAVGGLAAG